MFHKCFTCLILAAAMPLASTSAPRRPALASFPAPQITLLQQRGKLIYMSWTRNDRYDFYEVTYTERGRPGYVWIPASGEQRYEMLAPVAGAEVIVRVRGWHLIGVPFSSPQSDPSSIIATQP